MAGGGPAGAGAGADGADGAGASEAGGCDGADTPAGAGTPGAAAAGADGWITVTCPPPDGATALLLTVVFTVEFVMLFVVTSPSDVFETLEVMGPAV
jgi:hypothetical protein